MNNTKKKESSLPSEWQNTKSHMKIGSDQILFLDTLYVLSVCKRRFGTESI